MPRLKKYVGRNDYYVHAAFRKDGRVHNVTYQITPFGLDALFADGVKEDGRIDRALFHYLLSTELIYTGGAGSRGTEDNDLDFALRSSAKKEEPVNAQFSTSC